MPTSTNVLNLTKGQVYQLKYDIRRDGGARNAGLEGAITMIHDTRYPSDKSASDIWASIRGDGDSDDGVTYLLGVQAGAKYYAYVGKTINEFNRRYPVEVPDTGGLGRIFDLVGRHNFDFLDCTLYNNSYPAALEGWCYHICADDKGFEMLNVADPV